MMLIPFSKEARRHFDPVAQQFGLTSVVCTESSLRYENDKVFLNVNFDSARSFELGVEIGKKDARYPGPPFDLAEVLRLRGVQDSLAVNALVVSDPSWLKDALARLADLTMKHASDFLTGNDLSFAQVAKWRNKESAELALASKLRYARADAEAAWIAKDFKKVVKALEPVEAHLSEAEKKRLDYSRKQVAP